MLGAAAATGFTPYWLVAVAALAAALGVKRFSAGILIAVAAAVVLSAWLPFRGNEYRRLLPGRDVGGEFRFRLDDPALTRTPGISPPRLVRAELLGFRLRGERDFRECGGRFFAIFPTGVRTPDFGALVTAEGVFALPDSGNEEFRNFNFRTYLEARGADRLLRIDDFQVAGRAPGWYGKLLDFRDLLLTRLLSGVDSDTVRNLAAALYFGVDGGVSGSGRELFVASGTIHLFSVSGMHVGVLALLFWLVSSPLRFEWRWPLVVAALAAYVLGTGANPPALRAFLPALKRLLRENRRKEIAALVRYPLILEENTLLEETIRNPEEFLRNFDRIFTGEWIRKILATPEDELFPGWEGAGVGTGLLWIVPGGDRAGKTVRIGRFGSRLF